MSRSIVNFWLDVWLLVSFLASIWSAAVLRFVFPPGTAADGWLLWGYSYNQWFDFQFWMTSLFAVTVLVHVMLHWTWICGVIVSKILRGKRGLKRQLSDGERTLYGVGLLALLLHVMGAAFLLAMVMIQRPT